MQTFMPYADWAESARVLDRQRLGGQRKEGVQLLHANSPGIQVGTPELLAKKAALFALGEKPKKGWSHHAAAVMWRGHTPALVEYLRVMNNEWIRRGYKSTLIIPEPTEPVVAPPWVGDERVHSTHRAALLHKLPEHYALFGWPEEPGMDYYWPGDPTLAEVSL